MGLSPFSRSSYDVPPPNREPPANPDPRRFSIQWVREYRSNGTVYTLAFVAYAGVMNYEGRKVLLYEGVTEEQLRRFETIDPHFSDSRTYASPIARFAPSTRGIQLAEALIAVLTQP